MRNLTIKIKIRIYKNLIMLDWSISINLDKKLFTPPIKTPFLFISKSNNGKIDEIAIISTSEFKTEIIVYKI